MKVIGVLLTSGRSSFDIAVAREAQRLLEQADRSVRDVAHAVGYASDDVLRKLFSRRLGIAPTAHRRAIQSR